LDEFDILLYTTIVPHTSKIFVSSTLKEIKTMKEEQKAG